MRCDACGFRPPPDELWLPVAEPTRRERWRSYGGKLGCATWLGLLAIGGLIAGAPWFLAFVPIGLAMAVVLLGGIHDLVPRPHHRGRRFLALSADGYGVRGAAGEPPGHPWREYLRLAVRPDRDGLLRLRIGIGGTRQATRREWLTNSAVTLLFAAAGAALGAWFGWWLAGWLAVACVLLVAAAVVEDVVAAWCRGLDLRHAFTAARRPWNGGPGWLVESRGLSAAGLRRLLRQLRATPTARRDAFHVVTHTPQCLACGYDRSGLPPRRKCPECGEPARQLALVIEPTPRELLLSRRDPTHREAARLERRGDQRIGLILIGGLVGLPLIGGLVIRLLDWLSVPRAIGGFVLIIVMMSYGFAVLFASTWPRRRRVLHALRDNRSQPLVLLSRGGIVVHVKTEGTERRAWDGLRWRLDRFGRDTDLWRLHISPGDAAGLLEPAADVLFCADPPMITALRRRLTRWAGETQPATATG